MPKQLRDPVLVQNCTRVCVLSHNFSGEDFSSLSVTVQARQAVGGRTAAALGGAIQAESQQRADGYTPVSITITDTSCDTYLPTVATATRPFFNPFAEAFTRTRGMAMSGVLTRVITAMNVAPQNQKAEAMLSQLAADGCLPPFS